MKHFSWSLDTIGFFAATVADAAFVAAACSHRDLNVNERDQTPPRFGLYRSAIDTIMDEDMATALDTTAKRIGHWGGAITELSAIDAIEAAREAHTPIQDFEARLALADERLRNADKLTPALLNYLNAARNVAPQDYDDARRTANRGRKASHDLFEKCDVLLVPSAPGTAPETLASTGDSIFNRVWTLLGLPCVNVRGLKGKNGLPLGLQVVGRFGRDKQTLQAAHWLEQRLTR